MSVPALRYLWPVVDAVDGGFGPRPAVRLAPISEPGAFGPRTGQASPPIPRLAAWQRVVVYVTSRPDFFSAAPPRLPGTGHPLCPKVRGQFAEFLNVGFSRSPEDIHPRPPLTVCGTVARMIDPCHPPWLFWDSRRQPEKQPAVLRHSLGAVPTAVDHAGGAGILTGLSITCAVRPRLRTG